MTTQISFDHPIQVYKSQYTHGLKLALVPKEGAGVEIIENGTIEPIIESIISNIVQKGFFCLDLGTNYGHLAISMAFSAGEFGEVHAYEANPLIHEYAKLSAWLNGLESHSLYFYNFAISDVSGKEILFDGGASTYVGKVLTNDDIEYYTYGAINLFTAIKSIFAYFGVISYQSYTMSVDDIMSNHANKTLNFLRADIEGSECRMLQGAVKSIPQFPDIIIFMEWEPTSIKKLSTEQDISFCVQFLKNEDFKLLQLDVNYADLDLKLTNETLKLIDIEHLLNKGDKGEYILLRDLNVVDSILSICSNCRDHDVLSFDNNTNIQDSFGFSSFNLSQEITFTETGDL